MYTYLVIPRVTPTVLFVENRPVGSRSVSQQSVNGQSTYSLDSFFSKK